MAKVLICGVYLADHENWAADEIRVFFESRNHEVEQRWIALDVSGTGKGDLPCTVTTLRQVTPKFTLINGLLEDLGEFEFVVFADDDVKLPPEFLDPFLALVDQFGFAIAQPARTPDSYVDHLITTQMPGLTGRLTRFVEIGPVFCIRRSAFRLLLPFDTRSPMGWGLDYVWPALIERHGLRMGIIDATPVGHNLRKPLTNYSRPEVERDMKKLLQEVPHLSIAEAFTVLEAYA
jgi:hypothetical protein